MRTETDEQVIARQDEEQKRIAEFYLLVEDEDEGKRYAVRVPVGADADVLRDEIAEAALVCHSLLPVMERGELRKIAARYKTPFPPDCA